MDYRDVSIYLGIDASNISVGNLMSMDIFQAITGRRSIRTFKTDPVSRETLIRILEAAQWAPSAGNMQARDFIVVEDQDVKVKLAEASWGQYFIAEAPVVVVVCANLERSAQRYGERGRTLYAILDAAAAVENMLLAAYALGLGTCWIGAFDDDRVKRILSLPDHVKPIAIIPIGYPGRQPRPTPRIPISRITYRDRYGNPYFS
ncbi:MAG: nitroreductase family protein [Candidatus Bathyarchaeia archaeon]